jgi:hypothetical protein
VTDRQRKLADKALWVLFALGVALVVWGVAPGLIVFFSEAISLAFNSPNPILIGVVIIWIAAMGFLAIA